MHPLDLIKIRLQLSPEINTKRFKSLIDVISKINTSATTDFHQYKQAHHSSGIKSAIRPYKLPHTVLQYYRGIGPNIGGNIVGWSLYFTLYAEFKRLIDFSSPTANYFTSSTAAGVTTGLLTNPIWVLKTRILGTTRSDTGAYKIRHRWGKKHATERRNPQFLEGNHSRVVPGIPGQFAIYLLRSFQTVPALQKIFHHRYFIHGRVHCLVCCI